MLSGGRLLFLRFRFLIRSGMRKVTFSSRIASPYGTLLEVALKDIAA